MNSLSEPLYHVTTLSNFARAFDKYTRHFRKSWIPESRYPLESYLLPAADLGVGVAKASRLRDKQKIPGDGLLVLRAAVMRSGAQPNLRNGVGLVWPSPDLPISGVFKVGSDGRLGERLGIEQVMAKSLALHSRTFIPYSALRPRSVSFLPIARGCQAACPFCFSEASVSADQVHGVLNVRQIEAWAALARSRGAERAVITGGGEPTLLPWRRIQEIIHVCRGHYEKVVLITNGVRLASLPERELADRLRQLAMAGLSVLAVSRHHHRESVNAELMKLKTMTPALLETAAAVSEMVPQLKVRLVCVLQHGGVESVTDVDGYIRWAAGFGVGEICFKELYIATSEESVYFSRDANAWSACNQVPLGVVHDWARENGFEVSDRLPWGSPIFSGTIGGRPMRVAAYTEPSLFWERSHGLARSWNVMADGTCLASLEDRGSDVTSLAVAAIH
jgi:pyruvate-formate lyase-activating enzyme